MAKPLVLGGSERTMFSATRPLEACGEVASHFTLRHKFSGEKSQLFANIKLLLEGAWISTEIYNISHKHRNRKSFLDWFPIRWTCKCQEVEWMCPTVM